MWMARTATSSSGSPLTRALRRASQIWAGVWSSCTAASAAASRSMPSSKLRVRGSNRTAVYISSRDPAGRGQAVGVQQQQGPGGQGRGGFSAAALIGGGQDADQVVGTPIEAFDPAAGMAEQWGQVAGVGVQEHAVAVVEDQPAVDRGGHFGHPEALDEPVQPVQDDGGAAAL